MNHESTNKEEKIDNIARWIRRRHSIVGSVVIDEIHVLLTSQEFRPVMNKVTQLMTTKVPITIMTATLPIRLEQKLKDMIGIPGKHKMIRAATGRPEHQYFLFKVAKSKLFHCTIAFVLLSSRLLLHGERRGILFVRSIEMGQNLCRMFPDFGFIHGNITDDGLRSKIIQKWKLGQSGGWIIGTTSLIQGLDYHDVHLVVFVASPFSMIDFVQGAGRAGRNGKPSKVIVLHAKKPYVSSVNSKEDLSCIREMVDWVGVGGCRRVGISKCMDRKSHDCASLANAVPCDTCKPDHELQELWRKVQSHGIVSESTAVEPVLTTVTPGPLGSKPLAQFNMIPLRPRLAPPDVIRKSLEELSYEHARMQNALECLELLEIFSPNCGICHAESGGIKYTNRKHEKIIDCKPGSHFKVFYDYNKPAPKVRGSLGCASFRLTLCYSPVGCMITMLATGAMHVPYHKEY